MIDKRKDVWKTTGIALGLIALAFFLLIVFFGGGKLDAGQVILRLAFPSIVYAIAVTALTGRKAELFAPEKLNNPKEQEEILKALGATPLITLLIITFCSLAFLAPLFLLGRYTGVSDAMKAPLFLLCLSLALLGSAFVYVLLDRVVSQSLSGNNLISYPRNLREGRLSVKMFIIPSVVAIITFLFAIGLTMLVNRSKSGSSGFLAVPFLAIVFTLAYTLKKNTEMLYDTVILQLENLSSAKKDLKCRVSVCSVDEMGTISGMMNDFSGNIENGMRAVKECQRVLSVAGVTLKREASTMAGSLAQIAGHIGHIRSQSEGQLRSVGESSSAVQQISKNIEKLNASITKQSSSVSQASASIEELVGNVNSIAIMVGRMMDQFKGVSKASGDGSRVLKESAVKVQEIVQQSKTLQDANRIIAAIASQTNLLAMNAAIEAAHAGEAGRGFAVVADEIRKLAETSTQESSKISAELKQIAQTISDIVKGSSASGEAFDQISSRVAETEKLVSELNSAVKEQQEGADQILRTLKDLIDVTSEVNTGSQEMNKGNTVMLTEMAKLQTVSRKISSDVEQVSGNIERVNAGARKVSEMAENNESTISDITKVVNEFEV